MQSCINILIKYVTQINKELYEIKKLRMTMICSYRKINKNNLKYTKI